MKRNRKRPRSNLLCTLTLAMLLCVLFVMLGCTTPPREYLPPLPEGVSRLIEKLGPPEIFPGVAMTLVWRFGNEMLCVFLAYDTLRGWEVTGYGIYSNEVPPKWVADYMVAQIAKDRSPGEGFE